MDTEEQAAYNSFEALAKFIEDEKVPFANVYRGKDGVITITMGIPMSNGEELLQKIL